MSKLFREYTDENHESEIGRIFKRKKHQIQVLVSFQ